MKIEDEGAADAKPALRGGVDEAGAPASRRDAGEATHEAELVGEIAVAAPDGERRVPFSVALADDGSLVVFSFLPGGASVLDRFDRAGAHLGTIVRLEGGDARGRIKNPAGVAIARDGALYIPDADRNVILKLDATGRLVTELGGSGSGEGELLGPRDVDVRDDGALVVADAENHRVQVWSPDGGVLACFGAEVSEDDESRYLPSGSGPGEFFRPLGVTFDGAGKVWVADTNNHRLQRLAVGGGAEAQFGAAATGPNAIRFPIDLRVEPSGRLVVADRGGMRVAWFSPEGVCERAVSLAGAMPEGAAVADVDVDDEGTVLVPLGPLGKILLVRAGQARA